MQRASINPSGSATPRPVEFTRYSEGWRGPKRGERQLAPDFLARAEEAASRPRARRAADRTGGTRTAFYADEARAGFAAAEPLSPDLDDELLLDDFDQADREELLRQARDPALQAELKALNDGRVFDDEPWWLLEPDELVAGAVQTIEEQDDPVDPGLVREYLAYPDVGCEPQLPSCLECPLVECRFDVAGGLPQAVLLTLDADIELPDGVAELSTAPTAERETERNAAILRMRDAGRSAVEIGEAHGLTKSQVNRVLRRAHARVHAEAAS